MLVCGSWLCLSTVAAVVIRTVSLHFYDGILLVLLLSRRGMAFIGFFIFNLLKGFKEIVFQLNMVMIS